MDEEIVCPNCQTKIPISAILMQQVALQVEAEVSKVQVQKEKELKQKLEEQNKLEMEDLRRRLKEREEKVGQMREAELKLREDKRKLEDREKDLALELQRKLDSSRKQLEEQLTRKLDEEHRLKELEKEKVIKDLQNALEDARRKAQQGSQQLQGEVQELDLEMNLVQAFPDDVIEPVGKGVRGADVKQIVRTARGTVCGVILWESKRTKNWTEEWISKLKNDLRSEKANLAIIVSAVLPEAAKGGVGVKEGVVICNYSLIIPVCEMMRQKLIEVAREKYILANRESKAEGLYEYITGLEFRQHIEAIAEVYQDMSQQITRERAAYERIWKTREAQVQKLLTNTAGLVGSIRGHIGQSLPVMKGIDLISEEKDSLPLLNQ